MRTRALVAFSLLVMASMVLGACAPAATATPAPTAAGTAAATSAPSLKNADTMVEATIGDAASLDPAWAYDTFSDGVIQNVYETLVFFKREHVDQFVPMLATSWDISSDGMTYTFHIRPGVKFQDGSPMTPQDVAYSFWRGMVQDRSGGPQWIVLEPFFGLSVQTFAGDVVGTGPAADAPTAAPTAAKAASTPQPTSVPCTGLYCGDWVKATQAVEQAVTYDNNAMTVTMHLKQPYGPFMNIMAGAWGSVISMPWAIKQGDWDGKPEDAQKYHDPAAEADPLFKVMNGTGPYMLSRWAPGTEVDLDANPNYWVTTPLWDGGPTGVAKTAHVVFKEVSEFGTRLAMLQAGDADIAVVDRQYVSQVDPMAKEFCVVTGKCTPANACGTLRVWKGLPTLDEDDIFFNQAVNTTGGNNYLGSGKLDGNGIPANFFSDLNIRKGFAECFDYNTFISQIWKGEAEQALGPIIDGELGFDPTQPKAVFDLTQCANDFKASTIQSASGKSVWDTGFYVQYIYNIGNDQRKSAGDLLAANLLKVNPKFKMAVVGEPWPVLLNDQAAGRLAINYLGWLEDYHDPQDWVVPYLASSGTYSGTQSFAKDLQTQLDQLINQGVTETDPAARAKIYGQLQNLAYQNYLDIWMDQPQARHYEQEWVHGYYFNPAYSDQYFYALSKGM
jgi:peptide/nickel transport system substrate-binding protein